MLTKPLTKEHVVAEIISAICSNPRTLAGRELHDETDETDLDLGLKSISLAKLFLESGRRLDVTIDVAEVAMRAEITITELADLIAPA